MLVKITAIKYFTIIDPFPIEGVGPVTLQQAPGTYKEYEMYPHQAYRLLSDLDAAKAAGMLTYEADFPGGSGPSPIDQDVLIEDLTLASFFVGRADIGSSQADPVWQIKKVVEEPGEVIVFYFADGSTDYNKTWDDRASYTYN